MTIDRDRTRSFIGMAEGTVSGNAPPPAWYQCRGDACQTMELAGFWKPQELYYFDGFDPDGSYKHWQGGWYCDRCLTRRLGLDWRTFLPVVVTLAEILARWDDYRLAEARSQTG